MTIRPTYNDIREYLGHNGQECRVRIHYSTGNVERYGSPDPTDRSADYWQWCGTVSDLRHEIQNQRDW